MIIPLFLKQCAFRTVCLQTLYVPENYTTDKSAMTLTDILHAWAIDTDKLVWQIMAEIMSVLLLSALGMWNCLELAEPFRSVTKQWEHSPTVGIEKEIFRSTINCLSTH